MAKKMEPRAYVLWLLGRRDYSRAQLEKKLKQREVSPEEIRALLDPLVQKGILDETRYARSKTRSLLRKGFSVQAVKSLLKNEKCIVTPEDVALVQIEMGMDPKEELLRLVAKSYQRWSRRSRLDDSQVEQRVIRSLAMKGHRVNELRDAYKKIKLEQVEMGQTAIENSDGIGSECDESEYGQE